MQPDSSHSQAHTHSHTHGHSHGPRDEQAGQPVPDLKSPVLIGVAERLACIFTLIGVLWLVVFWALHTHG